MSRHPFDPEPPATLIPTVFATNSGNPFALCAEAFGVPIDFLMRLIKRGLITTRHTDTALCLRISDAGKNEIRNQQKGAAHAIV